MLRDLIMITSICVVVPTTMIVGITSVGYVMDKIGNYLLEKENKRK